MLPTQEHKRMQPDQRLGQSLISRISRSLVLLTGLATVVILGIGLLQPAPSPQQSPKGPVGSQPEVGYQVGQAAPNFTLETSQGKKVSLSDFRGHPMVVNFWYAGCACCVEEIPDIQQFYADRQKRGFMVLGVNSVDSKETIEVFSQRHHMTYPVVVDQNTFVTSRYNVTATPTSFFIDRQGIIRAIVVFSMDNHILKENAVRIGA